MEDQFDATDNIDLNKAFKVILTISSLSDISTEVAHLILNNSLSESSINEVVRKHCLKSIVDVKEEMLDLVLMYSSIILKDNKLTQKELINVKLLKRALKIKEGDFYRFRNHEIKEILYKQLARIYRDDNNIDDSEALYKVELQELFSLGYDQFLEFANNEDFLALERGANVMNLDTFIPHSKYESIEIEIINNDISKEVKEIVLERDNGNCAVCHGKEDLTYTHVIPIIKGGANTSRNIQLLCRNCKEEKNP